MDSARRPVFLTALLLAAAVAAAADPKPTVVRLRPAVGDTIDLAERDSFHLFPNTPGFQRAVILELPGPEYFAKVARVDGDSLFPVYYPLQPGQLERIRFLIDYRDFVAQQQKSDLNAVRSLASFWQTVEARPLRSITEAHAEPDSAIAPASPPAANEYRYYGTLLGATAGSGLGGCVGSWASVDAVDRVPSTNCLGQDVTVPLYSVNHPVFWTTACGLTALGTAAGYVGGGRLDRSQPVTPPLPDEGKEWRTGCAIGAAIPGFILGAGFFLLTGPFHYGRTAFSGEYRNDPALITALPMALTGVCIAVEVTTVGYYVGRIIDRQNAEKAEKKRRSPG